MKRLTIDRMRSSRQASPTCSITTEAQRGIREGLCLLSAERRMNIVLLYYDSATASTYAYSRVLNENPHYLVLIGSICL